MILAVGTVGVAGVWWSARTYEPCLITTPSGRVRDVVRIRCNLLAIPPEDFRTLADRYAAAAARRTL